MHSLDVCAWTDQTLGKSQAIGVVIDGEKNG